MSLQSSPCKNPSRGPIKCGRYLQARLTKTRLCKYITERGSCEAGSACAYAHSEAELVPRPDLRKTKLCYAFLANRCKLGDACSYAHTSQELREVQRLVLPLDESEADTIEPNFCSPYVEYVTPPNSPSPYRATKAQTTQRVDSTANVQGPIQNSVADSTDYTPPKTLFIPLPKHGDQTETRKEHTKQVEEVVGGESTPETPLLSDHPQVAAALQQNCLNDEKGLIWPHFAKLQSFFHAENQPAWTQSTPTPHVDRSFVTCNAAPAQARYLVPVQASPASPGAYLPLAPAGSLSTSPYFPQNPSQICPIMVPFWNQFINNTVHSSPGVLCTPAFQMQHPRSQYPQNGAFC
ncbi:zinc finger (CCCH type) motif-containing protein [Toxoplasma gondii VAND]|uniref:Zinc finger (CCCH type) motif-containing protein n=1 Tax=Toxoplasma gondii VAND TaxID=933077 RepID=A0A086PSQ0_TOXGO|nr:zinc finger (CCCH type) motif-containing protein [Toxoplasma gondii VAND]